MQCEYYALEGLSALMSTLKNIQETVNPGLYLEGILRTMFDNRSRLTTDVSDQLVEYFGNKVFRTCVPRNIRLAEAPSHGLPVLNYDKASRGAVAYIALAGEMIRKEKN
jgi:chromosome partitioning protein